MGIRRNPETSQAAPQGEVQQTAENDDTRRIDPQNTERPEADQRGGSTTYDPDATQTTGYHDSPYTNDRSNDQAGERQGTAFQPQYGAANEDTQPDQSQPARSNTPLLSRLRRGRDDRDRLGRDDRYDRDRRDRDGDRRFPWKRTLGAAAVAIAVWELAVEPAAHAITPESRQIEPRWQAKENLVNVPWVSFQRDEHEDIDSDGEWRHNIGTVAIAKSELDNLPIGDVPAIAYQTAGDRGMVTTVGNTNNLGVVELDNNDPSPDPEAYAVGIPIGNDALNVAFGSIDGNGVFTPKAGSVPYSNHTTLFMNWFQREVPIIHHRAFAENF